MASLLHGPDRAASELLRVLKLHDTAGLPDTGRTRALTGIEQLNETFPMGPGLPEIQADAADRVPTGHRAGFMAVIVAVVVA